MKSRIKFRKALEDIMYDLEYGYIDFLVAEKRIMKLFDKKE